MTAVYGPFVGTLTDASGNRLVYGPDGKASLVLADPTPAPDPQPTPSPFVLPKGTYLVQAGGRSYPLAGYNPGMPGGWGGDSAFPGCRGKDMVIAYAVPGWTPPTTRTNQYGAEAVVDPTGKLGVLTKGKAGGLTLPTVGSWVISGHGAGMDFLAATAPGATVQVVPAQPAPVPTPTPTPVPTLTKHILGVYLLSGVGHVSQIPSQCNRVLRAFYQGTGLVSWGGDSLQQIDADLTAWAAKDPAHEVLVSLGGQGGNVDLGSVGAGIKAISAASPVHGIDFDAEAFSYSPAQAVSTCQASAAALGVAPADFRVQFVPPGGPPVQPALDAAVACKAAGFDVTFGQQTYMTSISDQDVTDVIQRAVNAIGPESVLIGMMLNDGYGSWTVDSAVSRTQAALAKWPTLAGCYLWESSRQGTAEWGARVGAVLGL